MLSDALAEALKHNYSHAAQAARRSALPNARLRRFCSPPMANRRRSPMRSRAPIAVSASLRSKRSWRSTRPTPYPVRAACPRPSPGSPIARASDTAVVAMPTIAAASDLAGQLAAHKFVAEATNRGRDAVDHRARDARSGIILVDMNIIAPDIRQVRLRTAHQSDDRRHSDRDPGRRWPARCRQANRHGAHRE